MAGGGCWSSLVSDLVEQVSVCLSTDADHTCVHQVCTHWRSNTRLPTAYRPWIIAHRTPWSRLDGDDYSFFPLRRVERIGVGVAPAGLPYCCGASHGWLALTDHANSPTRLVLWEPLSNAQIPLPCLSPVTNVFLSGDPLTPSPSGWNFF
uniref:KIB1-4 beta-propeller domain-containing protein n=1 Tax=Aegilops tauschii TaxID=37682 RepID=R7WET3_AEGTA